MKLENETVVIDKYELDFDAKIKTKNFSIELVSASVKLTIESMMDEIKPVVTEKDMTEHRIKSKLTAVFESFGLSGYRCKDQTKRLLDQFNVPLSQT